MAKVELKQPIVDEIAETVKDADSVILVQYSGVTVETDTQLRREMREAGVTYKVFKNTMMGFAFKGTDCEPLTQHLQGPNAIAVSKDDATAPVRIISKYAKTIPSLKMIAGIVEGQYYDEKDVTALAEVPSREVLLGRLFGSMQSSIANLARVLKQIAEKGPAVEEEPAEEVKAEETPAEEVKAEEAEAPAEKTAEAEETKSDTE